jgi:hypothetical protein
MDNNAKMIVGIIAIILTILVTTHLAFATDIESTFHNANKAYAEGNYAQAQDEYEVLINEGIQSSSIHNNLGETLFRQGKLGQAIFQLMMAHDLSPRDADIKYNLNYVRNQITDKLERGRPHLLVRPFNFVEQRLSHKDAWSSFVFISILFWGLIILFLFVKRDWLKWAILVLGCFFLFHSALLLKKELFSRPFGVVTAVQAAVYSAPDTGGVLLFNLHEGSDFKVLSGKEDGWLQIKLPDGKKGWISQENVIAQQNS